MFWLARKQNRGRTLRILLASCRYSIHSILGMPGVLSQAKYSPRRDSGVFAAHSGLSPDKTYHTLTAS